MDPRPAQELETERQKIEREIDELLDEYQEPNDEDIALAELAEED